MTYSTFGTTTFLAEPAKVARIAKVAFDNDNIIIRLSDNRSIYLAMSEHEWLRWLLKATPEQRNRWEIVPSGGGVWWEELDEGIELQPLLDMKSLS